MPKFTPRQRKHKVIQRLEHHHSTRENGGEQNASGAVPGITTEKDKKRENMKNTLRSQQGSMSSKKQRRLEKYIVGDKRILKFVRDLICSRIKK